MLDLKLRQHGDQYRGPCPACKNAGHRALAINVRKQGYYCFAQRQGGNNPQFKQTKEQVIARLWAVLGNRTFLRMFSAPRSKVDVSEEINTPGKVVLINAEKGLLKEEGTELFGRFFLALINQAAAQRSTLAREQRLPCFVYVDECHNYIRNDPKFR